MNLQIIKRIAQEKGVPLRMLAFHIGMTESNLHRCVRENRIMASDLERIALHLEVDITLFFDKEVAGYLSARSKEEKEGFLSGDTGDGGAATASLSINYLLMEIRKLERENGTLQGRMSELSKIYYKIEEK